jgi:hypothetical protein
MNVPEREPVTGLAPEAVRLVDTYFARVHGALLVNAASECEEAVDDLRAHILEALSDTAGTPADVTRVLAELGPPEALAAEYAEDTDGTDGEDGRRRLSDVDSVRLHGKILGMPYDVRVPSTDRIASRWWNPLDPRVLVPRVFGLGWDVNFGALAVKLHLVRPDDEDEPFAAAPRAIVAATLALPLLIAAALIVLVAATWPSLPAQLPSHWNMAGQPDQFWPRGGEVAFLGLMALVPAAVASWVHLRKRPALNRVAGSVFATFLGTIALSQFVQVLYFVAGDQSQAPTFVGLAFAFVVPFVMLVTLSRVGRAAEQRRDMSMRP